MVFLLHHPFFFFFSQLKKKKKSTLKWRGVGTLEPWPSWDKIHFFMCVQDSEHLRPFFFSFIFFFYKGKKYIINIKHTASDSPLNQHWHRVKNVKQNDDNTVQSQSSESSAFKKNNKLHSVKPRVAFFFLLLLKMEAFVQFCLFCCCFKHSHGLILCWFLFFFSEL